MAGGNIGSASIEVGADARGFASDVTRQAQGPLAAVGSTLASALGATFKAGMAVAATAVGVTVGVALTKGLGRLEALDLAQAKMRGLGFEGQALEGIMDSANNAVLGTAFGLGEAADAASLMLTSGVQAGTELDNSLNAIVATASATGSGLSDITAIWQTMAAAGKVSGQQIFQLQTRGVNALAALADHFGITQEAASEMVSAGEVSFEDFNAAMTSSMGNMAEEVGNSFSGMRDNIITGLGRVGAALMGPFFNAAKTVMPSIVEMLRGATDAATGLAESFEGPLNRAAESLTAFFEGMSAGGGGGFDLSGIISQIGQFSGLIAPLAGAMLPLLKNIPYLGRAFSGLTGPVGLAIGLFVEMFRNSETLRDAIGNMVSAIGPVMEGLAPAFAGLSDVVSTLAGTVGDILGNAINAILPLIVELAQMIGPMLGQMLTMVAPLIGQLGSVISSVLTTALQMVIPIIMQLAQAVLPVLMELFSALMPVISELASAILPILNAALAALAPVFEAIIPIITMVLEALMPLVTMILSTMIPVIQALLPVVTTVFNAIGQIVTAAMQIVQGIIQVVTGIISGNWSQVWTGIKNIFAGIWNTIKAIVTGAFNVVKSVITAGLNVVKAIWNTVWSWISTKVSSVWNSIKSGVSSGINAVRNFVTNGINAVRNTWNNVWNAIRNIVSNVWNGIRSFVSNGISNVRSRISSGMSSVRSTWNSAWNAVKNLMGNIWNGIVSGVRNGISNVMSAVTNIKSRITGFFSGAGSWLVSAGRNIISGLTSGIRNAIGGAIDAVRNGVSRIRNLLPFSPAKEGPLSGRGYTLYSGQALARDLARGIESQEDAVVRAARRMASDVQAPFQGININGMTGSLGNNVPSVTVTAPQQRAISLTREDMDYLVEGLVRGLWPAAKATEMVEDIANMGKTRMRMGVNG